MQLLVGLGNPGAKYQQTRHNAGFMAVEAILRRHDMPAPREKFRGLLSAGNVVGHPVTLFMPMNFMNLSGEAVGELVRFHKIPTEAVTVFHDDLDLAFGKLRIKRGGGNGGHNGLKSLDAHIGKDYRRVRIGIGHPGDKDRVSDYVLHPFGKDEAVQAEILCNHMADTLPLLLAGDEAGFMNKIALAMAPPKPETPALPKVP